MEKGHTEPPVEAMPALLQFLGYDPLPEPKTLPERLLFYGLQLQPLLQLIAGGISLALWHLIVFILRLGTVERNVGALTILSALAGSYGAIVVAILGMLGSVILATVEIKIWVDRRSQ